VEQKDKLYFGEKEKWFGFWENGNRKFLERTAYGEHTWRDRGERGEGVPAGSGGCGKVGRV